MLGLGETLARRRGLLRAMKSLRGLEDYYRRIVFSVADQTTPRDNRVDVLTKPTITTPTRLRTALFTRLSHETFVRSCSRLLGGWVRASRINRVSAGLFVRREPRNLCAWTVDGKGRRDVGLRG